MNSNQRIKYSPLDPARDEIRVFSFNHSQNDARQIHIKLETVSLKDYANEYRKFLQDSKHASRWPSITELPEWIEWSSRTSNAQVLDPERRFKLPYWRWLHHQKSYPELKDFNLSQTTHTPNGVFPEHLEISSRFEWGDFEAISYCWHSDSTESSEIMITINEQDQVMQVHESLAVGLRMLSKLPEATQKMKFWVDYICINQDEDQDAQNERAQQIKLMGTVYSRALAVICWLGECGPQGADAVKLMKDVDEFEEGDKILDWIDQAPWTSFISFLSTKYWQRLWIIQELALNHNITLFLYGEHAISRRVIQKSCFFCIRYDRKEGLIGKIMKPTDSESLHPYSSLYSRVASLSFDLHRLISFRAGNLLQWPQPEYDQDALSEEDHPEYVAIVEDLSRKAQCTKPHDKLYGVLGILPHKIQAKIKINYDMSLEEVFKGFALALLEVTNRIDNVLSWVILPQNDSNVKISWVPDWTRPYPRHLLSRLRIKNASSSKDTFWHSDSNKLYCKGVLVDVIAAVGECPNPSSSRSQISTAEAVLAPNRYKDRIGVRKALTKSLLIEYNSTGLGKRSIFDIYWIEPNMARKYEPSSSPALQHVGMDEIVSSSRWSKFDHFRKINANFSICGFDFKSFFPSETAYKNDLFSLRIANLSIKPKGPTTLKDRTAPEMTIRAQPLLDDNVQYDMHIAGIAVWHRRLATTQTGYIGLVPEETEPGDAVVVISGCGFPLILRRGQEGFRVVGETYMAGIMDGEIQEAIRSENSEYHEIDIVLE